jgi:hypothetical protein
MTIPTRGPRKTRVVNRQHMGSFSSARSAQYIRQPVVRHVRLRGSGPGTGVSLPHAARR